MPRRRPKATPELVDYLKYRVSQPKWVLSASIAALGLLAVQARFINLEGTTASLFVSAGACFTFTAAWAYLHFLQRDTNLKLVLRARYKENARVILSEWPLRGLNRLTTVIASASFLVGFGCLSTIFFLPAIQQATDNDASIEFHVFGDGSDPGSRISQVVESDGWVFFIGQTPNDPNKPNERLPDGIDAQANLMLQNLGDAMERMGLDFSDLVFCRSYLEDFDRDYAAFTSVYARYFQDSLSPSQTTHGVMALNMGALVGIDCMARRP